MKAGSYPLVLASAATVARDTLRGEVVPTLTALADRLPTLHPQRKALMDIAAQITATAERLRCALRARERT